MTEDAAHILIIDDDARLRDLLKKYLSDQGFRVTAATHAAEARERLRVMEFDLLIVDVMMPGESGLELTQALRGERAPPILLLTALGETEDRIAGFEHGADDYLAKPFEPRELILRIQALLRRAPSEAATQHEPLRFGPYALNLARQELRRGTDRVHLTEGECALLCALARRPGEALSRETLAERAGVSGNARAVDVQITRLRRKIEEDPRYPRHLQTVRGIGYVLMAD